MERYTRREGDRIAVPQERLEEALARLAQLEDMMQDLAAQQEEIPRRLQELRSQGREKTVQAYLRHHQRYCKTAAYSEPCGSSEIR